MTLELPPKIVETLTRIGAPPEKEVYWQSFVGPDEISLVLMKTPRDTGGKPQVVASAVQKVQTTNSREVNDVLREMRVEIEHWVQLAAEVHVSLGVEVRLSQIGKESS